MNTHEWKTEYQQRAEQTQARRRATGMYRRPTEAQDQAYRHLIARGGWRNVTVEDAALLAAHPWLTCTQREQFATRVAQDKMNRMCAAMVGDDAYMLGRQDSAVGRYSPPAGNAEHDSYIRGWNDAWAATQPAVKLIR